MTGKPVATLEPTRTKSPAAAVLDPFTLGLHEIHFRDSEPWNPQSVHVRFDNVSYVK